MCISAFFVKYELLSLCWTLFPPLHPLCVSHLSVSQVAGGQENLISLDYFTEGMISIFFANLISSLYAMYFL